MAQNIIIDIQVQDGKAQAKIRGLEGAFKDLKDVIKDARDQLKEQNKVLTGSAKYYEKQISDLKKFRDETAKTGLEYRKQTAEINKLVAAQQSITGPVAGSVAALQRQRNALIKQQKQLATTAKQYDNYAKKIASVQLSKKNSFCSK
jgi:DNA repair exonuclease SbcCD ATPase subunit